MPCLLYYRPKHTNSISLELVKEWGLGYAFTSTPEQALVQGNTPDGNSGSIFQDNGRSGGMALLMDLTKQTWGVCAATGCWVGYWNEHKPGPADLARARQLPGYEVALGDGCEWKIPLVRRFDRGTKLLESALPCSTVCGADGKWTRGKVLAAHAELWEVTKPFAEAYAIIANGGASPEFTDDELGSAAVKLLQKNYAIGAGEMSVLGLLNEETGVHSLLIAACDAGTYAAWAVLQKKTSGQSATDGASTSAGETGEQQNTDQLGVIG